MSAKDAMHCHEMRVSKWEPGTEQDRNKRQQRSSTVNWNEENEVQRPVA